MPPHGPRASRLPQPPPDMRTDMESPGAGVTRPGRDALVSGGAAGINIADYRAIAKPPVEGAEFARLWLAQRRSVRPGMLTIIAEAAGLGGHW